MAEDEVVVKSKGSNLVLIIVIALLLVILIVGSLLIYFIMSPPPAPAEAGASASASSPAVQAETPKPKGSASMGVPYPMEPFTVNLASENDSKYLKVSMVLEQNVPELTPEIDKKKPMISDTIISILSSKSFEEISTTKGKERLKEDLIQKINDRLNDGFIKNIFFTEFLLTS